MHSSRYGISSPLGDASDRHCNCGHVLTIKGRALVTPFPCNFVFIGRAHECEEHGFQNSEPRSDNLLQFDTLLVARGGISQGSPSLELGAGKVYMKGDFKAANLKKFHFYNLQVKTSAGAATSLGRRGVHTTCS